MLDWYYVGPVGNTEIRGLLVPTRSPALVTAELARYFELNEYGQLRHHELVVLHLFSGFAHAI